MTHSDKIFATKLIRAIIKAGYLVAVHNGEHYERFEKHIDRSEKISDHVASIVKQLGATGEDTIQVITDLGKESKRHGGFFLIYNNGFGMQDMDGVVADYSDNEVCNTIYNSLLGINANG